MEPGAVETRWRRLAALLEPFHQQAAATARRLCRSAADGDDLYQDTVLRAFEKLHTLRDEARFRSWFFATLLSRHRARRRRSFWRRFVPLEAALAGGVEPVGADGAGWDEDAWRAKRAAAALARLAAVQREAVVLFEIEGRPITEIAELQGVSVSAVKSRLARARARLRRHYASRGWSGGEATATPPALATRGATGVPPSPPLSALATTPAPGHRREGT